MQHEVHLFLGTAIIAEGHKSDYPVGGKHAVLLFLRENTGSDYDIEKARKLIESCKLSEAEFTKVGRLDPDRVAEKHKECYENAIHKGYSLVIYKDPINVK